jgi:hypothetical protein
VLISLLHLHRTSEPLFPDHTRGPSRILEQAIRARCPIRHHRGEIGAVHDTSTIRVLRTSVHTACDIVIDIPAYIPELGVIVLVLVRVAVAYRAPSPTRDIEGSARSQEGIWKVDGSGMGCARGGRC